MDFTIVHFRLTADCTVYAVCTDRIEEVAIREALKTISNIKSKQQYHPVLNFIDGKGNVATEFWSVNKYATRYNGRPFIIYADNGWNKSYTFNATGVRTAFGNYAENILDPYCYGTYHYTKVTILVDAHAADYFVNTQSANLSKYKLSADANIPIVKQSSTDGWKDFGVSDKMRVEGAFKRTVDIIKQLDAEVQQAKEHKKPETIIDGITSKYRFACERYQAARYDIEGSPLEPTLIQMEDKLRQIRADITDIKIRAEQRSSRFINKAFGNANDSMGTRLKNLFSWK